MNMEFSDIQRILREAGQHGVGDAAEKVQGSGSKAGVDEYDILLQQFGEGSTPDVDKQTIQHAEEISRSEYEKNKELLTTLNAAKHIIDNRLQKAESSLRTLYARLEKGDKNVTEDAAKKISEKVSTLQSWKKQLDTMVQDAFEWFKKEDDNRPNSDKPFQPSHLQN